MSLLFTIIRAAHANGSHHKLALDALLELGGPDKEKWQRLLLKHAEPYLKGSKAPDDEFKDFKNHVLHVRDDYWGGAPERAQYWYAEMVDDLRSGRWPEAARAAGILSHYVVDPLQPLHTGQSDAENAVHRAIEWSINRSFDTLRAAAPEPVDDAILQAASGPQWLAAAIAKGAELANAHYENLILHYDLRRGVVDPPAGLDANARRFVGVLIRQATALQAHVLDRGFAETGVTPPDVQLTAETILAALKIPAKLLAKRISNAADRAMVVAMYDELTATGKVEATLDEENRIIRDLHRAEVVANRPKLDLASRFPLPVRELRPAKVAAAGETSVPVVVPDRVPSATAVMATAEVVAETAAAPLAAASEVPAEPAAEDVAAESQAFATGIAPIELPAERSAAPESAEATRDRLTEASPLVDAHSIGPKTAARLAAVGISTVGQFLAADAGLMAASLNVDHIKAADLLVWQQQARLGCEVLNLRGGHTQILVALGCTSRDDLAAADPAELYAAIEQLAASLSERERMRLGKLPTVDMVTMWINEARQDVSRKVA